MIVNRPEDFIFYLGETADMIHALRQIIDSCVENDLSAMDMPMFDIEYIFLQLRAKSVGEKIDILS